MAHKTQATQSAPLEKNHSPILIPKTQRDILDSFTSQNGFPGYGEAIQALITCYGNTLKIKKTFDYRQNEIDKREQQLDSAEKEFLAYEQKLRDGAGVSQQAFDLITSMLETTDKDTVEAVIELIRSAAIPVEQLSKAFQEMGGAANYLKLLDALKDKLMESVSELEQQKTGMEDQRVVVAKELIGKRREVEQVEAVKERARQEVEGIALAGKMVEAAYGQLGIILENVVGKLLQAGTPLTALPPAEVRLLAGVILETYVQLYGDQKLNVPVNQGVMRLVPVPVLLSELPGMLAPQQVYDEVRARLAGEEEKAG